MSLWKRLQAALVRLGIAGIIIAFIAGIVAAAYFAAVFPDWTGFGPPLLDSQGNELPHAKTLWDWLGLLLVPLVLAIGGFFLTRSENRYALEIQDRREKETQRLEDQRIEEARKLEEQRTQEAALQAHLDQMTQLLLHEKLRTSQPKDEIRSVARARTLTVLRVLDGVRKGIVLQFLYEAGLIGGIPEKDDDSRQRVDLIIHLGGADLREVNLSKIELRGLNLPTVDLSRANLSGANLYAANLVEANLTGANLSETALYNAFLAKAKLTGAQLTRAQLTGANLEEADLSEADLTWAYLLPISHSGGTNLYKANLAGADLTNCEVTRYQLAEAASLEGAKLPFD